jgi:hypothetical protein
MKVWIVGGQRGCSPFVWSTKEKAEAFLLTNHAKHFGYYYAEEVEVDEV